MVSENSLLVTQCDAIGVFNDYTFESLVRQTSGSCWHTRNLRSAVNIAQQIACLGLLRQMNEVLGKTDSGSASRGFAHSHRTR